MVKKKISELTDNGVLDSGDILPGNRSGSSYKFTFNGTSIENAISGTTYTTATVAGTDKVLIQDTDASDALKTVTAQSIADLASSSPGGSDTQLQYNNSSSFGGISSLTYNGSNVTSTAGFIIDGTADEIQLKVQGHSTQTSNILEIENSAATNLVTVSNAGLMTISGALTVDNISINGNTISSSSGAVTVAPASGQAFDVDLTGGAGVTYDFTGAGNFTVTLGTGDFVVTGGDIDLTGNISVSGTVDGRDIATDGSKLDGIEALADVTDETNVVAALDGATLTAATVAGTDKVLIQDVDASDALKTVTAQSIADLASASPGGSTTQVQYNSAGSFAGISGATSDGTTLTLVAPVLGTPASGTLTNCTGLPVAGGGTGLSSATAYAVLCGGTTGTGAFQSIVSVGSSGQVLTSNGAGALPTMQTPAGGAWELVSSSSFSSVSSVEMTSAITSSYDHYFLALDEIRDSATSNILLQFSTNNGSSWITSGYEYCFVRITVGSSTVSGDQSSSFSGIPVTPSISSGTGKSASAAIHIYHPLDSSYYTTVSLINTGYDNTTGNLRLQNTSGSYPSASAVNALRIVSSGAGNISGKLYLLGLKNS